jgi:hypothetical protein
VGRRTGFLKTRLMSRVFYNGAYRRLRNPPWPMSSTRLGLLCLEKNVPKMYPRTVIAAILAFGALCEINKLRVINIPSRFDPD